MATRITTFQEFDELRPLLSVGTPAHTPFVDIYAFDEFRSARISRPLARQSFYTLVFCQSATYTHQLSSFTNAVSEPMLLFIPPGLTHSFAADTTGVRGFTLFFKAEFLYAGIDNGRYLADFPFFRLDVNSVLPLSVEQATGLASWFERIRYELAQRHPYRHELVRAYLTALLWHCRSLFEQRHPLATPPPGRALTLAQAFDTLTRQHCAEHKDVGFYADQLNVRAAQLAQQIRQVTGQSAAERIRYWLVEEAKALLLRPNVGAAEAGYQLGFADPAQFSKLFRRVVGAPPRQWQQRHR